MEHVDTADGVRIAVHELGGPAGPGGHQQGPAGAAIPLVLMHATGFCGPVMGPLARRLAGRYRCLAPDERAHGASGLPPGLDFDWHGFAADALAVVDGLGLERPLGVGHSCGGTALLLAAQARPGTFRALYCYEPIVFLADPPVGVRADNPLSQATRRRREVFESREAALANFSSKPPLSALDPEVLAAYVRHGFTDLPDGRARLACRPEHEARIYELGAAHDAYLHLGEVACPVTIAWGQHTAAGLGPADMEAVAARIPRSRTEVLAGVGHFGLLEDTDRAAASVLGAFDAAASVEKEGQPGALGPPR